MLLSLILLILNVRITQVHLLVKLDKVHEAQEHNRVNKRSLKNWMVMILSLHFTVNKLNQMANVVVGIIVFALWLLILRIATTHFFVFLSLQLLLAVFILGTH
jgi:mechanosensitive ion channel protein 4/5/6/7/8/9/10